MFFEHGGFGTLVGSQDEYAARGFSVRLFFVEWQIFFREGAYYRIVYVTICNYTINYENEVPV